MLHEYFTQKLFTRKNGEHWIRISNGRMFSFGLNMLHIADHKFDICEQKNNWWFWFGSFPMKICLWENFFYGIETTCGHHRKTEFQVEFPSLSSEHFLMTEEVRCNLWLSSPDIFCFCATSVHFSLFLSTWLHSPHHHPSPKNFTHSKLKTLSWNSQREWSRQFLLIFFFWQRCWE